MLRFWTCTREMLSTRAILVLEHLKYSLSTLSTCFFLDCYPILICWISSKKWEVYLLYLSVGLCLTDAHYLSTDVIRACSTIGLGRARAPPWSISRDYLYISIVIKFVKSKNKFFYLCINNQTNNFLCLLLLDSTQILV